MKYIQFEKPGDPDVMKLAEGPMPELKVGEVLIRVEAAGVNRPDVLQRKGAYPPPTGASPILGLEVAGTIEALGPASEGLKCPHSWKVGDRVCALVSGGGYAEYCAAPAAQCLPIPRGLSVEEAAGIPETYFTVWTNVFKRGRLEPGESILIHGGSSGIGTTAIQLAKAFGAHVYVTAGSEEKCQACLDLGAAGAVNYKTHDFVTEVKKLNGGQGVNVILDMVGGEYFNRNLELLANEGRLVQIAFQKGDQVSVSLRTISSKGLYITGSTLRPRSVEEKGRIASEVVAKVWPLLESRKVRVLVNRVFPFAEASEAHRWMEKSEHIGKIILKVAEKSF